ncbi:MAG: hypothetical protein ACLQJR_32120 [Stellaceae bacterium]
MTASPELVALLDTERAMRDHYNRTFARIPLSDEEDRAKARAAVDRRMGVFEAAERFQSRSMEDLALKARAIAEIYYDGCEQDDPFMILLADIERLVKGGAA